MARTSWWAAIGLVVAAAVASRCAVALTPTPIAATASPTPTQCLRAEYQANPVDGQPPSAASMTMARDIIERRVNTTGVADPVVQTQGTDRIVVQLPGVRSADDFRQLIGSVGRLDFVTIPAGTTPPSSGTTIDPILTPLFSGDQLASADLDFDTADLGPGERAIAFTLKPEGARLFAEYTTNHVGESFAIVLDGAVIEAPVIQAPIPDGRGRITGTFSEIEQNNLVTVLKYGALPFAMAEVSVAQVPCNVASPS